MGVAASKERCDEFCEQINAHDGKSTATGLPWYTEVKVDGQGCRKFAKLPPPGTHPRLFFTKEEIPALVARFKHSTVYDKLNKVLGATLKVYRAYAERVGALSDAERENPTETTIRAFFVIDETRNSGLLGTLVWSFIENDTEMMMHVKDLVVFYCRVVLAARDFAWGNEITEKPFSFWHTKNWDVSAPWLSGGSSFALIYDLMYNDMTKEERDIVRGSIAACCKGRQTWGINYPARRVQSNWAPYNSQLYVLLSAIEDEEGFDEAAHSAFENIMINFMHFAFHDSGHPMEDAYAINLGLREGSYTMLAMARRGLNLFNHPNYKKCLKEWLPFALEPQQSGQIYGGSSGSHFMYPTALIIAKFVYPTDEVVDFVYRKYISPNGIKYIRHTQFQSRLPAMFFGLPVLDEDLCIDEQAASLNLPLTFYCSNRGKMIMRSDWCEKALWYTLDARPDAFLIGHDSPSRGQFVLNASGRSWGICPEWKSFTNGNQYSIPAIDCVSQKAKAPSVRPLGIKDAGKGSTYAAADLTYAYNWEWTSWAGENEDLSGDGFELEPSDPRDFGMSSWWLPNKLYGERNTAFQGLHQWRRRLAKVQHVTRSALMVRTDTPYMLLCDRVRKGENECAYTWAMVVPIDVELASFDGRDAILSEKGDSGRRLLIRTIGSDGNEIKCRYETIKANGSGTDEFGRIVFEYVANEANFRFLVYPLVDSDASSPSTEWKESNKVLEIKTADGASTHIITLGIGDAHEVTFKVE